MGSLQFGVLHNYEGLGSGIVVPVIISTVKQIRCLANVDTGASFCIFKREHGEELGLDIEKGIPQGVSTVTGTFMTYGHEVTLQTLGFQFSVNVYFARHHNHPRNVLGRQGWLRQVRLGLIDYEAKLYASKYDD
ncbi:MAG TPA: aspartyl protease family protein [Candidatus Acidoferrales bacterium]|jgi:hypothetical protein|nr:aspartyl protease family protein [Candidatus Acidoferrales bacterium]